MQNAFDPPASVTPSPRDRLLNAATQLFGRYGINAVGVDAVVEAAGTAKTTLYKAFGSKERLVEAVLEQEGERWRTWFTETIEGPGGSAQERLDRIFPALGRWFAAENFFGCPFINAVGEHDKLDPRLRALVIAHKGAIMNRLEELMREAGYVRTDELREQLAVLMDGSIVKAMATRDPGSAASARRAFEVLCAAHMGKA